MSDTVQASETPAIKGLLKFACFGAGARKPNKAGQKAGLESKESRNDSVVRGPFCPLFVQRDDGRWSTGLHDDGPGFESRQFAEAVAARLVVAA